jgi:hypothetical protein
VDDHLVDLDAADAHGPGQETDESGLSRKRADANERVLGRVRLPEHETSPLDA